LGEAVLEGLATYDAHARVGPRLPDEVLAAAKADLQPHFAHGSSKQLPRLGRGRLRQRDRDRRQRGLHEGGPPGAELPAAPTPVTPEVALPVGLWHDPGDLSAGGMAPAVASCFVPSSPRPRPPTAWLVPEH